MDGIKEAEERVLFYIGGLFAQVIFILYSLKESWALWAILFSFSKSVTHYVVWNSALSFLNAGRGIHHHIQTYYYYYYFNLHL